MNRDKHVRNMIKTFERTSFNFNDGVPFQVYAGTWKRKKRHEPDNKEQELQITETIKNTTHKFSDTHIRKIHWMQMMI